MRSSTPIIVLALAAPASARADADAPASTVTVGGYVEPYYQFNLRDPGSGVTDLRGFDDLHDSVVLQNVAVDVAAERGPVHGRVTLQFGTLGTVVYAAEPVFQHVQQAFVGGVVGGVTLEAGLFPSPIGPEVYAVKDNWTWSRSNAFFALPFYHAGVRASVPLGESGWTAFAWAINGWNDVIDNNAWKSVIAGASYANDAVSATVLYNGGVERPTGAPEGQPWRHLFDVNATVTLSDRIAVMAQADAGLEAGDLGTSWWATGALYGQVKVHEQLYVAARADVFREQPGEADGMTASRIFFPTDWIASGTLTLAYQPADGLSLRLEYRHDQAADDVFDDASRAAQDTITLGATAWF